MGNNNDIGNVEKNIVQLRRVDTKRSGKIDSKQAMIRCGARTNVTCPNDLECTGYFGNDVFFASNLVQDGICTPSNLLYMYIDIIMIDRSFEQIEYAKILL